MKKITIYSQQLFFLFSIVLMLGGCKKLVDVDPPTTSINSGNVYSNDATAIGAVTNLYVDMSKEELQGGGISSLNLFPALSADELFLVSAATNNSVLFYFRNALTGDNLNNPDFWAAFYKTIYATNASLEGLNASNTLTPSVKQQLVGEVKFMRAFCYFYLVNLYGDVPLILTTDYKNNSVVRRTAKADVYAQIINDLKEAQSLLSTNYLSASLLTPTAERVRPTKWAATALLSRVYLYTGEYSNAEELSTAVINYTSLFRLPALNKVFLKNSDEAIWQLQPVNTGWNTEDARIFLLPANGPDAAYHPFYLNPNLINSFETGDHRKQDWINSVTIGGFDYYFPTKYRSATYNDPITEYKMVFRLGEQYLIRAEAEAQLGQYTEAKNDLNTIKTRAGLPGTTANDKATLLAAILHERQVELFTEWGHRWFDLKRTGSVDAVMSNVTPQKGGTWNTNWQWYPISKNELLLDPNLVQNQGY